MADKYIIEIPEEFDWHFKKDRFEDSLNRLSADAHFLAGNYEQETVDMLINAFKNAIPAADVRPVVHARWTRKRTIRHDGETYCPICDFEPLHDAETRYCPNCGAMMDGEG